MNDPTPVQVLVHLLVALLTAVLYFFYPRVVGAVFIVIVFLSFEQLAIDVLKIQRRLKP